MENLEKRPPSTPEEEKQNQMMEVVYRSVYESAKNQGIISDEVSLEEFKKMKLSDVMTKLKEKGLDRLEIKL